MQKATNPGGGENYGWRLRKGTIATPTGGVGGPAPPGAVGPIFDYPHTLSASSPIAGQAVIGGYVYHGSVGSLQGQYIFGDLEGPNNGLTYGRIFSLTYNGTTVSNVTDITNELFANTPVSGQPLLYSFGVDGNGDMYILDGNEGEIFKIVPEPATFVSAVVGCLALFGLKSRRGARSYRI